jgi:hypothetical protein
MILILFFELICNIKKLLDHTYRQMPRTKQTFRKKDKATEDVVAKEEKGKKKNCDTLNSIIGKIKKSRHPSLLITYPVKKLLSDIVIKTTMNVHSLGQEVALHNKRATLMQTDVLVALHQLLPGTLSEKYSKDEIIPSLTRIKVEKKAVVAAPLVEKS